jgi:hypothetical protein
MPSAPGTMPSAGARIVVTSLTAGAAELVELGQHCAAGHHEF